jgi:hypothetical protein
MKSIEIKKGNGTGTTIYHRFPRGNDIVSTAENHNAYWGPVESAPSNVDFVVDGDILYYKTYDRDKNIVWQKIYVGGAA